MGCLSEKPLFAADGEAGKHPPAIRVRKGVAPPVPGGYIPASLGTGRRGAAKIEGRTKPLIFTGYAGMFRGSNRLTKDCRGKPHSGPGEFFGL